MRCHRMIPVFLLPLAMVTLCLQGSRAEAGGAGPVGPPVLLAFEPFQRGDANIDGALDIADAVKILNFLFPPPPDPGPGPTPVPFVILECHDAADVNDDEALDVADPVYLLTSLFSGGAPPPAPYNECGHDPTFDDVLTCNSYPPCAGFTDRPLAGHLLRRIAYGTTPDLLDEVEAMGASAYIDEQLHPELIDESQNQVLNDLLATLEPQANYIDLYKMVFIRGLFSERQLQEQLADFWDNHFNTYLWTTRNFFRNLDGPGGQPLYSGAEALALATYYEHRENQALREGAVGEFLGLLHTSAESVTMLIYLDSISNVVGNPNENYARELLELHSMGVDNGYTQQDIEQLARCFTGWTVCKVDPASDGDPLAPCLPIDDPSGIWSFHFAPADHDYGAKTIFPGTSYTLFIPPRPADSPDGVLDGFEVLEHLATLPQTAEFVSTKLIQKLVSDEAPPALVAACVSTWLSTGGDLREVIATILVSDEFQGDAHRWNKVETPMENLIGTVRAFGGWTNAQPVLSSLFALRHIPFNFGTPDGFPEFGADQLGTSKLLDRIKFNKLIQELGSTTIEYDLVGLLESRGIPLDDVEAIADFFLDLLYQGNTTAVDRQLAIDFLSTDDSGNPVPLIPAAIGYELRIAKFAAFAASLPQGMKQ